MPKSENKNKNLSDEQKRSFIKILSSLAAVDNDFNINEKALLMEVAEEWGISGNELDDIVNNSEMPKIEVPQNEKDRIEELAALIGMMMIDRKIYEEEFQLCSLVAMKFGFKPDIVNNIIADILERT
ncbi:hypothetical protein ACFL1R_00675 [Candidatus Latescibacterota bacterium]